MLHDLKTIPLYFSLILCDAKQFEVRKNDRNFSIGDELLLREYEPAKALGEDGRYTGRILHRRVDYILTGEQFGIIKGFAVLSLSKI